MTSQDFKDAMNECGSLLAIHVALKTIVQFCKYKINLTHIAAELATWLTSRVTEKPAHPQQFSLLLFGIIWSIHLSQINSWGKSYYVCDLLFITELKSLDRTFRWQVVIDLQFLGVQTFLSPASSLRLPKLFCTGFGGGGGGVCYVFWLARI